MKAKPRKKPKVSRQQLLADLKKLSDDGELLNCALTKAIDESPCDYVEAFAILKSQLKWMRKAERDEHGPLTAKEARGER